MQKHGRRGVVMTDQGKFVKVVLPHGDVQLGTEIQAKPWHPFKPLAIIAAAVAVMLLMMLVPGYQKVFIPQAAAYVTLDINPSVELAVDKNLNIIEVQGLNEDGQKLLGEVDLVGLQLNKAIPLLVNQAVADEYLDPQQENVVLSTVTITENGVQIDDTTVQKMINQPLQDKMITVRVLVERVEPEVRNQAKKSKMSAGKYLVYTEAQRQGIEISIEEVRAKGITQLEQREDLEMEKIFTHWIPPGHLKKMQELPQDAQLFIPPGIQKQLDGEQDQHQKEKPIPPGQAKKQGQDSNDQWMPPGLQKKQEKERD